MNKEIHKAQMESPTATLQTIKATKNSKPEKTVNGTKTKTRRTSKRTAPGKVLGQDSAPGYVHTENSHWLKTIEKQTLGRGKRLIKKILKGKKRG